MKLHISLAATGQYLRNEELYDHRAPTGQRNPIVKINMPRKIDGTQAVTKMNGRMVLITYWSIPKPSWTLAMFDDQDSFKVSNKLNKLTNISDVSGNAAEYLYFGHI